MTVTSFKVDADDLEVAPPRLQPWVTPADVQSILKPSKHSDRRGTTWNDMMITIM